MKFAEFNDLNENKQTFELYVVKSDTKVEDDLPPHIDHRHDDYEKYVNVIIKAKGNDKDYVAITVGANPDDHEYKLIDKNIHVSKSNDELLKYIKLSDSTIEELALEAAELAL